MNGLYVGVILALCFSEVSMLECVVGTAYGSSEIEKRNEECYDAEFCVNYTYKAGDGAGSQTHFGCSTAMDTMIMDFFGGSPCEQDGCREVINDGSRKAHPNVEVCCCDEDFCNDENGQMEESVKREGNRWRGRVAILNSWD
uniref:Activin types I and II receptor domain-containing protein n=1 Tax=Parascaris univalens TaxID=6257 RepID=A0A915BQP4_PARUN